MNPIALRLFDAAILFFAVFLVYVIVRYVPIVERNAFEIPRHRPPADYPPPPGIVQKPFSAEDPSGRLIEASIAESPNPSGRVVVFCHETAAGPASWSKHLSFLPEAGYDVVTFGYESGETYQWPSRDELAAVDAVLSWLYREKKGAKVALFGVSKGAALALAASKYFSVLSVVLDGAFSTSATLASYMKKWVSIYVRPEGLAVRIPGWFFRGLGALTLMYAGVRRGRFFFSAEPDAARLSKPVFFIHAANDPFAALTDVERLRSLASRAKTELWVAPDAGHSDSVTTHPAEYRRRVLDFLSKTLGS